MPSYLCRLSLLVLLACLFPLVAARHVSCGWCLVGLPLEDEADQSLYLTGLLQRGNVMTGECWGENETRKAPQADIRYRRRKYPRTDHVCSAGR